jgi:predicted RNase H-like nuclease
VHSPNVIRPGLTGTRLQQSFEAHNYVLATSNRPSSPALLEVYPHVALLGLTGRSERLPYKVSKRRTYWRGASHDVWKHNLVEEWAKILGALQREIADVSILLPAHPEELKFSELKRFEDAIDAVVCAWTAALFVDGSATALGDESAAIWVPGISMPFARGHDAA